LAKFLILKTGALGDLSFLLPAVDQIRKRDPQARITWIVGNTYAALLRKHPGIQQVITVNEKNLFHKSIFLRCYEALKLWLHLDSRYDQIWIGHRTLSALLLLRLRVFGKIYQLTRAPSPLLSFFRNEVMIPPLSTQEGLGFKKLTEKALQCSITLPDWQEADTSWIPSYCGLQPQESHRPAIVIHVGGGANQKTEFELKKWPHWGHFLRELARTTSDDIILVGAPNEQDEIQRIFATLESPNTQDTKNIKDTQLLIQKRLISQVGKTSILELLSLLKSAKFFIGVDSGPLHWADSFGIPSIGIYGPTSSISWGLLGKKSRVLFHSVPCSPCYRDNGIFPICSFHHRCMTDLSPKAVMDLFVNSMLSLKE